MSERFRKNWITVLIAMQPALDIIAYWRADAVATEAGYIRLAIMLLMPLSLLIAVKNKKRFILPFAVMGLFCLLHFMNCRRVGYIDPYFDVSYMAKVIQMPVLAICLIYYLKDDQTKEQAVRGILLAAGITGAALALACITGTENVTYGEGLGVSGWVIDSNRCANSIILVTLSVFAVLPAVYSEKKTVNILLPVIVAAVFITNGTKACYYSIFAIFGGYAFFVVLNRIIGKKAIKAAFMVTLVILMITAVVIYPYTPRYKVTAMQQAAASKDQGELERKISALGYDPKALSREDKLTIPEVREVIEEFYYRAIIGVIPDMIDRFGMERILDKYDVTLNCADIISTRLMKLNYAALVWDECDLPTRIFGFEVSQMGNDGLRDVENDWPALFYYYGYLGLAMYAAFVLYFIYLIIKKLRENFKDNLTALNFALGLALALQLGLAQFSGALIRRPNVSVYLSVILALVYYQTVRTSDVGRGLENEA